MHKKERKGKKIANEAVGGLKTRFPLDTILGQLEAVSRCLKGEVNQNNHSYSEENHYKLLNERYKKSKNTEEVITGVINIIHRLLDSHLPEGSMVVEYGAGSGLFSEHAINPIIKRKKGILISTELSTNKVVFSEICDSDLRARARNGVDVGNIKFAENFSVDEVIGVGVLDVLSVNQMKKAATEFSRILKPGGEVIEVLDIGADLGWAKLPLDRKEKELLLKKYGEELARHGIELTKKIVPTAASIELANRYYSGKGRSVGKREVRKMAASIMMIESLYQSLNKFVKSRLGEKNIPENYFQEFNFEKLVDEIILNNNFEFGSNIEKISKMAFDENEGYQVKIPLFILYETMGDMILMQEAMTIFQTKIVLHNLSTAKGRPLNLSNAADIDLEMRKHPEISAIRESSQVLEFASKEINHVLSAFAIRSALEDQGFNVEQKFVLSSFIPFTEDKTKKQKKWNIAGNELSVDSDDSEICSGVYVTIAKKK